MRLSELNPGQSAVVIKVLGHGAFRKRIMEMGFIRGKQVSVLLNAPLQDPVKYRIMDYEVSLRRSEAALIEVVSLAQAEEMCLGENSGLSTGSDMGERLSRPSRPTINIALVGNPNSGKTSLFNAASGGHAHVGNYGGVTVDAKKGHFTHRGYRFDIVDLPGTYSLSAYSPEEVFVRRHIYRDNPDVIINVVAASNLERNLYLTTELIDMDCVTVMALNMFDELQQSGSQLDCDALGDLLGFPVVPTVSRSGKGIVELFDTVIDAYENRSPKQRHIHIPHQADVETAIAKITEKLPDHGMELGCFPPRYLAVKLLEGDPEIENLLPNTDHKSELVSMRDQLVAAIEKTVGDDIESIISNDRYGYISGALRGTFTPGQQEQAGTTRIIDSFVTHKLFGFPIFFLFMWLMFEATFSLGQYPMGWIESFVEWLSGFIGNVMPGGMLKDLLVDGIIGGVGGVIVFLPNILILYLFISFMEDSGYMARAAFIMDKVMHRIGLHGKSFIPLIMGFGCNVPAIMATRSIESRSSRLITILINPFMSCSARLPIYLLLVGAFFPKHGGLVMFSLYLFGILVGIISARLLRKFYFKADETPFVMELPPYRMPTARSTVRHMWEKAAQYLRKMGGIILVASIVVWFLTYFPTTPPAQRHQVAAYTETTTDNLYANAEQGTDTTDQQALEEYFRRKNSYIGRIGQFISPVMEPLGFEWRESVALLTGAAAKEVIVSTLGVLYSETEIEHENPVHLREKLAAPDPETGRPGMTPLSALSFLVFALLYFPCIAAMVAISRETGSWKWAAFSFFYNTAIAWIIAFAVYNIGSLFI